MNNRLLIWIFLTFFSISTNAANNFQCFIHVAKAPCWKPFKVSISLNLQGNRTPIKTFELDDKLSVQEDLACKPGEIYESIASFTPPIWKSDVGKTYITKRRLMIPYQLPPKSNAYVVQICYPADFQSVPLPIENIQNCECP